MRELTEKLLKGAVKPGQGPLALAANAAFNRPQLLEVCAVLLTCAHTALLIIPHSEG